MTWLVALIAGIAAGLAFGLLAFCVGFAGRSGSFELTLLPLAGALVGIVAGRAVGRWSGLGPFGGALLLVPVVMSGAVALPRIVRAWRPLDDGLRPTVTVAWLLAFSLVLRHLAGAHRTPVGSALDGVRVSDTTLASWTLVATALAVTVAWVGLAVLLFLPGLRRRWVLLAADSSLAELWGIDPQLYEVLTSSATAGAGVLAGIAWASVAGVSATDLGVLVLAVAVIRTVNGARFSLVAPLVVGLLVGVIERLGAQVRPGLGWILVASVGLAAAWLRGRLHPLSGETEIVA